MHLYVESSSKDYLGGSIKIGATTQEEAYALGVFAGMLRQSDKQHTEHCGETFVRLPTMKEEPCL